ncbi:MAG: protein kinase [Deltaproteobacteria bacterium]|nr:protein kinase [Deltaproteobacteria bacterium]
MRVCPRCRAPFPPGANFCPHDGHHLEDLFAHEDPEADRFIGKVLDERYQVEDRLGQGGMGMVYAARHVVIDKPVAIKILRHEYCRDPGLVERFIREARAASRIGHPNIVDVTDFGRLADGHIYFVMEYLVGTTLAREIREQKVLPLERVVDLATQICNGLGAAHAKGIVHRDLKPENVFIINPSNSAILDEAGGVRQDFVKILDFGIAKISWGPGTRLTKVGSIFGTPQYMSPEQAAGQDADHRGDVYSLGCIIYEMVTGEVPFTADTFMGTLTKHLFEAPLRPRELRPDLNIPEPVERLILTALAKDPGDRYSSVAALAAALQECAPVRVDIPPDATFPPGQTGLLVLPPSPPVPPETSPASGSVPVGRPLPPPRAHGDTTEGVSPYRERKGKKGLAAGILLGTVFLLVLGGLLVWARQRRPVERDGTLPTEGDARVAGGAAAGASKLRDGAPGVDRGDQRPTTAEQFVEVTLTSVPAGAQVFERGRPLGVAPLKQRLRPGTRRTFVFRLRGHREVAQPVLGPEVSQVITVVLSRVGSRVRPRRLWLGAPDGGPRIDELRNPYDARAR